MSTKLDEQINQLKQAIAEIEAQREILGDAAVDAALVPFRQKLVELEALATPSKEKPPALPVQQRKLVTLLFMDVVGSTSKIAGHLDPEDTLEIMDSALKRLAVPVEEHGGHVTRFMGDGFKAVFGAPVAREDDPEQAVRAGLDILEAARSLAGELESQWDIRGFQVRVGVNTGLVAIGGLTEAEDTIMGVPVNLAARLESAAPPGGLLISHDTYRHVRGVFDVEPQEPVAAKGFDQAVPVYLVQRARPRAFRLPMRGVEGVETRMFGRETELKYLQDALTTAIQAGEGQVVTITGEAGVGKSRLLYEFQDWFDLLPSRVRFFQGRGRQEAQGQPYALLRDLFSTRFQIQEDDSGEATREKIETGFAEVFGEGGEGQMRAHILGQLLGFDFSASPHLKGVLTDAEQLRNRGLMYLGEYFRDLCDRSPVVVFLEEIHWADDSSLDALNYLGERIQRQRLLVACVARHSLFERRPYWGEGQSYHTRLELRPLSRHQSRLLVGEILRHVEQLPAELRELVVSSAEGNPFYIEELIKMLVEDGVIVTGEGAWRVEPERLAEIEVPSTLAGVLQARLDSLPSEERVVLQQASVVGRLFWDRVITHIQAAGDGREERVAEVLSALRGRELIYRRETSAFVDAKEYLFKHDMLRDVTYESVLKRVRKAYHELVAEWLIEHSRERVSEYTGLIADHFLRADNWEKSWAFHMQAGREAQKRFASQEAIAHLQIAMDISKHLPLIEATERAEAYILVADVLSSINQYDEALEELERGMVIVSTEPSAGVILARIYQKMGIVLRSQGKYKEAIEVIHQGIDKLPRDNPKEMGALKTTMASALTRQGELEAAQKWCVEGIEDVETGGDLVRLAHAYNLLGTIRRDLGDTAASLACRLKSLEISQEVANIELQMEVHNNLAVAYYDLGQMAEAVTHYKRSRELSQYIGNLNTSARAEINLGEIHLIRGDWEEAEQAFRHALTIWESTDYLLGQAYGYSNLGAVLIRKGELKQALQYLQRSQDLFTELGAQSFLPIVHRRLATAHLVNGNLDKAEELGHRSLALARELSMPQEEGAALRILGEIYCEKGYPNKSENYLETSISIFREAGIQYEESRSSFELVRLWNKYSQYDRVKPVLDDIIESFRALGAEVYLNQAEALKAKLPK